jgi:hypothetical protein
MCIYIYGSAKDLHDAMAGTREGTTQARSMTLKFRAYRREELNDEIAIPYSYLFRGYVRLW